MMKESFGKNIHDQSPISAALELMSREPISCVVMQNGTTVYTADGRGVSPLLRLYDNSPNTLKEAFVVDKIIGKAAAMLLVLGGAVRVYGVVMSVPGCAYLEQHGIETAYDRRVDFITNRDRNGICPIEGAVLDIDDPHEGLTAIRATIDRLMNR